MERLLWPSAMLRIAAEGSGEGRHTVRQLTIRGIDSDLSAALGTVADRDGISLSKAALKLLRKGAGLAGAPPTDTAASLGRFVGAMTAEDAEAVDAAVEDAFGHIDASKWR